MKTKFAYPTERDLRFVRQSGFKESDFGTELRIAHSALDALQLIGIIVGVAALIGIIAA